MRTNEMNDLTHMIDQGYMALGNLIPSKITQQIVERVNGSRELTDTIFLSKESYDANPVHIGVNPVPGRNYTEACADLMAKIESHKVLTDSLSQLLGAEYMIMDCKFVIGVPKASIPSWVVDKIEGKRVNNLGAYIKPEYRDITYFWGIDLHQDIIDWKDRQADFITLYLSLIHI